jgi:branched-chain amino acid transport system ATP-binding protein
MLELAGVHAHYGLSHVLQGVDLTVRGGEIVGLFGRNGVGKTTLIKTVAGWLAPSAGNRICRLGIGLVPEDRRIFPGLSVEENLKLGLLQTPGRTRSDKRQAVDEIYARVPRLAERRRQLGTTLSGGEQQMLAIARVLVGRPRLLLIDEPTEGLAPMIIDEIFALIRELQGRGIAILLVEQNVQRALDVCGPIVALERGRVVFRGAASSAADRDQLLRTVSV